MTAFKTVAILLSLSVSLLLSQLDVQAAEVRVGGIHPGFVAGVHPGFSINRNVFENRNVGIKPGLVGPAHHWWRPGGAVEAGVAIGFVSAALVSDWAGPPPAPGYCWYYTDITHWYGFWDQCP
jgi:hypothetical protein